MKIILTALLTLALSGCASGGFKPGSGPVPVAIRTPYSAAEHADYMAAGNGILKGQAFLRQKGGGVVTCAGSKVLLLPATAYFREAMMIVRQGGSPTAENTSDESLRRQSQCDAQGNFSFAGLPAGTYIVITEVKWSVGYAPQGGGLMKEVVVPTAGTTSVLLTDDDIATL